ncbi:MAG: DUF2959 family protein, partial [Verrucomicrobia bacterium]|nr:DUF2959 family protein [Verrucomicrobiota bacterium]MDI9379254.1 DUF2959 family protein [Verrucomicrobiota bacterium]
PERSATSVAARSVRLGPHRGMPPALPRSANVPSLTHKFCYRAAQAKEVRKRIENMEGIAKSMFSEWEKELGQFSNPTFAENSRRQLQETKDRFGQLSRSVHASEESMKPVLTQLNDHVLYLKHNLNAAAIGSLKGEASAIQGQIEELIARINASIAEADSFIKTLPQ